MIFAGIQKSSLVDYPGLVSCVLFVPGCNYDCFYCHNRSLLAGPHEILDPNTVLAFLKKRAGLLDAVVVTGGEPTLQPELTDTLLEFKSLGYRVKLDTNGSNPAAVSEVLKSGACSYFAVDYKAPSARYEEICGTGTDAAAVRETVELLLDSGAPFEVRTTVIPQLLESDLMQMATELPAVPRWTLNRYRKPSPYKPCDEERICAVPWTQEQIAGFARKMASVQPNMNLAK
ncbi:anaerobic ribonucleoside-triphosphate reductase activating protein [Caproicibacter sp.]|uniref:anaerobic ribonucleoside-triphosphate reductase activating protein n=1 Tax=Caproicibacter sp. TaxID=2814884 RepID=UPI003988DD66